MPHREFDNQKISQGLCFSATLKPLSDSMKTLCFSAVKGLWRHLGSDQGNLSSTHLAGHMKGVPHCRAQLPNEIDVPVCHIQAAATRSLKKVQMCSTSCSGNAADLGMSESLQLL